jgi:glucokinase
MTPLIVALDFGSSRHTAAIAAPGDRQWRAHRRALAPPKSGATVNLAIMRSLVRDILRGARPSAIGVSFSGPVDFSTGVVPLSHPVPGWADTPLRKILEREYGVPVIIDSDAHAAALGEFRSGAGQGCSSLLYVTVSHGVRGGWIINGQPWRGANGVAGEIGQVVVDPSGPRCVSGKPGCVDCLASAPHVAQRVREALEEHLDRGQILRQLVGNHLTAVTARRVREAAEMGDRLAWESLEKAAWAVGVAIGNTANLMNPERFIIGGEMTKVGDRFLAMVRRTARETVLPDIDFDVVPASLGDDASLWGAVALGESLLNGRRYLP